MGIFDGPPGHTAGTSLHDCCRTERGRAALDPFRAGVAEQIRYFETLTAICRPAIPPHLANALDDLIRSFADLVGE